MLKQFSSLCKPVRRVQLRLHDGCEPPSLIGAVRPVLMSMALAREGIRTMTSQPGALYVDIFMQDVLTLTDDLLQTDDKRRDGEG